MSIILDCAICAKPSTDLWFVKLNDKPALICRLCNGETK